VVIISRIMRQERHVAGMDEKKNSIDVLVWKPKVSRHKGGDKGGGRASTELLWSGIGASWGVWRARERNFSFRKVQGISWRTEKFWVSEEWLCTMEWIC
jgi:hypothetical protein